MLKRIFHSDSKNLILTLTVLCAALFLTGCSSENGSSREQSDYIEYNGVRKNKNELSEDTIQWVEWYSSLPEAEQEALSIIPAEFAADNQTAAADMRSAEIYDHLDYHYREALSDAELFETAELVRLNYEEANDAEIFEIVPDDFSWYRNKGIEDEYTPGNIIIYRFLTTENRLSGDGFLIVSIGRHSKSDPWKIINSGF